MAPVTQEQLKAQLGGYVKFNFFVSVLVATIATPIICSWMLIKSHADEPHHEGAVSAKHFTEFKIDYRADMKELKSSVQRILEYHAKESK